MGSYYKPDMVEGMGRKIDLGGTLPTIPTGQTLVLIAKGNPERDDVAVSIGSEREYHTFMEERKDWPDITSYVVSDELLRICLNGLPGMVR